MIPSSYVYNNDQPNIVTCTRLTYDSSYVIIYDSLYVHMCVFTYDCSQQVVHI